MVVQDKTKYKVVILSRSFAKSCEDPLLYLENNCLDYKLVRNNDPENVEWIAEQIGDADAVIIGSDVINHYVMDSCPNLKVISKHGVGLDNVDLDLAKERGIAVVNTPDTNNESVADLTILLILSVMRKFKENIIKENSPDWKAKPLTNDLFGKTVGLIGYGKIGAAVARRLVGFSTEILVYDPYINQVDINTENTTLCSFDELLAKSDIVSLHLPLTESTNGMINSDAIAKMKDGAIVINTSRGALIQDGVLYEALKSGKLKGAGLDVFSVEPPIDELLLTLSNVVATPHIAPHTVEANYRMGMAASRNVKICLENMSKNNS